MYLSVKTISKSLDDYDHIKLITEEEPLQVDFEERPVYRNIIGKLLLNNKNPNSFFSDQVHRHLVSSSENSEKCSAKKPFLSSENKLSASSFAQCKKSVKKIVCGNKMRPSHRSVSLNDLLDAPAHVQESTPIATPPHARKQPQKSEDPPKNVSRSANNLLVVNERIASTAEPFYLPNPQKTEKATSPLSFKGKLESAKAALSPSQPVKKSILKKSDTNDSLFKRMEIYKLKALARERLEVDILPSHLDFSNNRLLAASASGKIRVIDLVTYKVQKDELKNLLINGICKPKNDDSNTFYAVTNGEMKSRTDELNVSDSAIIVTRSELKVLKKNSISENDNYLFSNPSGICYDLLDNVYISDTGFNRIKVLDRSFQLVSTIETVTGPDDRLSRPGSVTNFKNLLYVSDNGNRRIVCYVIVNNELEFRFKSAFGVGLKYPLDLCVDDLGILSARDHCNSRVQFFSPDSTPFHSIDTSSERETVYDMAVSDSGDIYVSKMCSSPEANKNGHCLNKYFIDIY